MYAVFQIAGKQFQAEKGDVLRVPLLDKEKGAKIDITEVLLINDNDKVEIGSPFVASAKVVAVVQGEGKDDKIRIYKYKRRTKYRRSQGHRQDYTEIKISKIEKAAKKTKSEEVSA